jgi:hypothetical protein
MQSPNINADVKSQLGKAAVESRRDEQRDYDSKGVLVVASAWLLLYALMFIGLAFTQGAEVLLASIH